MKLAMSQHVELNQRYMFEAATETVKKELRAMLPTLRTKLMDLIESILSTMQRDFKAVFVGAAQFEEEQELRELLHKRLVDDQKECAEPMAANEG